MVHKALEKEGTCTGEYGVGTGKIKYFPGELRLVVLLLFAVEGTLVISPGWKRLAATA